MGDYTPTTEQVRMSFVTDDHDRYTDPGPEFDRWLATHDREVAARALEEAHLPLIMQRVDRSRGEDV